MESSRTCPQCGKPLAASAPLGLCPACLLQAGFATQSRPGARAAAFVPPAPAELAPLFPQLEILALIGQGGMGAVYRARQPSLDRVVALKILPPHADADPGFGERFAREARALARLNHPNIVAVHDFGAAGGYPYFVMEFVDGVTLRQLLATSRPTPREALAIVPQICDALQFAHDRGIVHRDIKPENILIDRHGAVKIADFGLAKLVGAESPEISITGAHDVMGTPHYMAPEQVEHPLEVDHRADIYSLGVVFYQLLTGELPLGRFAPPSRKVQIDVRLDDVVLRALEKEPEQRYQRASGLKSEVETIATSTSGGVSAAAHGAIAPRPEILPGNALSREPARVRWLVLVIVWTIVGTVLRQQTGLIDEYLRNVGAVGAREATPLKQMYPSFAADAQVWVRHALSLLEGDKVQLRFTDIDNAPYGREVHWNSAWAWCIAGAGKLHQLFTDLPLPQAVERAAIWLNPAVLFVCMLVMSGWAARHLGVLAGVVITVAMLAHDRIHEGFFPAYVDHHGIATLAVFGVVLGAAMMGGGWWRGTAREPLALPDSPQAARSGAVFSALSGVAGLWIGASSMVPALVLVGLSAAVAIAVQGRTMASQGAVFVGDVWRIWGRVGAVGSVVCYLFEYFPAHLGLRLEANHPFYALAWLGAGELVAAGGERWLAPRAERWAHWPRLIWPMACLALVPATIVVVGSRGFTVVDAFMSALHRGYIQEFLPLWRAVRGFDNWGLYQFFMVGSLPLVAAIATLAYRRRGAPVVLWLVTSVTLGLTMMAWWQARWLLNVAGASIVLILVLLVCWTIRWRPFERWVAALSVLGLFFVPSVALRYVSAAKDATARRVSQADAGMALSRDIAATLRASQPKGDIVLLSSPNSSATIGYYGRFKTLGTLYWENGAGLKAAAGMLAARSDEEAEALVRERGVTHIAIVSEENFIVPYARLLRPEAPQREIDYCFGVRLMRGETPPAWLEPLRFEMPEDLRRLRVTTHLFKVRPVAANAGN